MDLHLKLKQMLHLDLGDYPGVCVSTLPDVFKKQHTTFSTKETIEQLIRECTAMTYIHYDYARLAGAMAARVLQQQCTNPFTNQTIREAIVDARDLDIDIFGFKTLERAYLLKDNQGNIVETPQYMWMRVALGIHDEDVQAAIETYNYMSTGYFTHATPTLFNSGTRHPQMSSCFLVAMKDDSIQGIFDTVSECAKISKSAGGIGLHIHNIRAKGSFIKGTNGRSNGIVPMLRVFNNTARYVDQGGGKRMGSFAIYLEPWHADIFDFLELKKNHGAEELRARDLFYALWIPDLFMKRVKENKDWTLFCPHKAPGLADVHSDAFETLYHTYEKAGKGNKTIPARRLWHKIIESQIETGTPYLVYNDACNSKSNQQNVGTIQSSNLCAEIIQYSSPHETAVCNLASIALPKYVRADKTFDYDTLQQVVRVAVRNLNIIIDKNDYPTETARASNFRHRPIGLGVQGLVDVFQLMDLPFDSRKALELNRSIFEAIYYAAVSMSCDLAQQHHYTFPVYGDALDVKKGTYASYEGSPASQGKLQFDLWGVTPSTVYDWTGLKEKIHRYGLRNSLLTAIMPTASTSQILGNNECCEPYTSNMYTRRVLSGEYVVINKHLCARLEALGLWTEDLRKQMIAHRGSIQKIDGIPLKIKRVFKTVWEIKQKVLIDMAVARGPYIDQSQSLNLFLDKPTVAKCTSMHFYGWEQGLKTGCYYLRSKPAADPIQFTVDLSTKKRKLEHQTNPVMSTARSPNCMSCGS